MNNDMFLVAMHISVFVKQPLIHYLNWHGKVAKEVTLARNAASENGHTYLGSTAGSQLVTGKAKQIEAELLHRLSIKAVYGDTWQPAWRASEGIDAERLQVCKLPQLMVESSLLAFCGWWWRSSGAIFF